jgi:hypothetical protein
MSSNTLPFSSRLPCRRQGAVTGLNRDLPCVWQLSSARASFHVFAGLLGYVSWLLKDLAFVYPSDYVPLRSSIVALGAFVFTDAIPVSMAAEVVYISLRPSVSPLAALRRK